MGLPAPGQASSPRRAGAVQAGRDAEQDGERVLDRRCGAASPNTCCSANRPPPHVTTVMEADMTQVVRARERQRAEFERQGDAPDLHALLAPGHRRRSQGRAGSQQHPAGRQPASAPAHPHRHGRRDRGRADRAGRARRRREEPVGPGTRRQRSGRAGTRQTTERRKRSREQPSR